MNDWELHFTPLPFYDIQEAQISEREVPTNAREDKRQSGSGNDSVRRLISTATNRRSRHAGRLLPKEYQEDGR